MSEHNLHNVNLFQAFTLEHLLPVLFFTLLCVIWIKSSDKFTKITQLRQALLFSILLAGTNIFLVIYKWYNNELDARVDLPFHLCNFLTLIYPITLVYQSRWFFGILYFWVLVGTFQAILTPELKENFPHPIYFKYWLVHCGLVMLVFHGLFVIKWSVYKKDLFNAIIGANIYLAFSFLINLALDSNYFYSMRKPETSSMLDYLGPWPWYLVSGQLIMILLFFIYFLPIHIKASKTNQIKL
jgi:hypothetical integral membrane protein (TIGR02206 family)